MKSPTKPVPCDPGSFPKYPEIEFEACLTDKACLDKDELINFILWRDQLTLWYKSYFTCNKIEKED